MFCFEEAGVRRGRDAGEVVSGKVVFDEVVSGVRALSEVFASGKLFSGLGVFCAFFQLSMVVLLMPVSWAQRVTLLPASVVSRRRVSFFFSSV